ncbi:MAG TPA: dihydrofolate reductase family protein, partial [Acidimicrobiales bacterium]|nr:dihydrofolate reductase family protein [Acidimicrobiales bacterium]
YFAISSVDGYVEDPDGSFMALAPDEEVHVFTNASMRGVDTYLYGRRMYETMTYWETADLDDSDSVVGFEFATMWRAATKVVYSRTLEVATTGRTRVEREFDADGVRTLKAAAAADLAIGGADLGGQALAAGLVDEMHLYLAPVIFGGGKPALPSGLALDVELLEEHRFASGFVHLRYGVSALASASRT